ncbi:hypothetical protein, partial [Klebsiella pneumoniae]|uniref:hypothetical protein n=1 Tax=Klebsiella pneumoniae TaxID=573 RepID=UPI00396886A9
AVDDRHRFVQVHPGPPVEQGPVVVLDRAQEDVAVQIGVAQVGLAVGALGLLLDGLDVVREQALEVRLSPS